MRYFWFAPVVSVLLACSPVPKELYRAPGADSAWEISGNYKDHTNELTITINGETVIKGTVNHRTGEDTLTGNYDGRAISVTCASVESYLMPQERCTVLVNGEQAEIKEGNYQAYRS